MRNFLILVFAVILLTMIVVTSLASIQMPIWKAFATFGDNPWAPATLWDAYFGFLTFFVWVCWREPRMGPRAIWFVLIMALGNIAMSGYVLIQLFRLPPGASPARLFTHRNE